MACLCPTCVAEMATLKSHLNEHPERDFYMIFVDGRGGSTKKHYNRSEAIAEAERLAKREHGNRVYLLKVETSCYTEIPAPVWSK